MSRTTYLLLAPAVATILLVAAGPVYQSIILSLSDFSIVNPEIRVVGIHNYINTLLDPIFWNSVGVTLLFASGALLLEFSVGIFLALLLFGQFRGKGIISSLLIIPLAVPPIVVGILTSPIEIFDDINTFLYYGLALGVSIDTNSPFVYYPTLMLGDAYLWSPLIMLVVLAIMHEIPRQVFEASEVMGASSFQTFTRITLPWIVRSPVLAVTLALRVVDALRAFEVPYAWSFWLGQDDLGSPIDTLSVLMWKMFSTSTYDFPLARIAAISIILLIISLVIAAFILRRASDVLD